MTIYRLNIVLIFVYIIFINTEILGFNHYSCPKHSCDSGIVCRNMFGNIQCVSQYDSFALINTKMERQWTDPQYPNNLFLQYRTTISNINSIPMTSFVLQVDFLPRLVGDFNSSTWGIKKDINDNPVDQLIHPCSNETILQSEPFSFGYRIKVSTPSEYTYRPLIRFKATSFTTVPEKVSLGVVVGSLNIN